MNKIELLSPAGDMSKLKTALYFGADAVYIGGKHFSLRALAGNFTDEEIFQCSHIGQFTRRANDERIRTLHQP